MTAPNLRESSAQAELNLALERYPARVPGECARKATGTAVRRLPGVVTGLEA
jgi:hypothetical protein